MQQVMVCVLSVCVCVCVCVRACVCVCRCLRCTDHSSVVAQLELPSAFLQSGEGTSNGRHTRSWHLCPKGQSMSIAHPAVVLPPELGVGAVQVLPTVPVLPEGTKVPGTYPSTREQNMACTLQDRPHVAQSGVGLAGIGMAALLHVH